MKLRSAIAGLAILEGTISAFAQGAPPLLHSANGGTGSALGILTPYAPTGGGALRSAGDYAGDVFNPKNYGAVGTGTPLTTNQAWGITTLSQLEKYTFDGASTPFSWVSGYQVKFNLPLAQAASTSATALFFATTQTTASPLASPGGASLTVSTGTLALPMADIQGLSQGMRVVCGSYTAPNTFVELVDPAGVIVHLSKLPLSDIPAGTSCAFTQDWLIQVANNPTVWTISGPVANGVTIPAGTMITAVNLSTGEVDFTGNPLQNPLPVVTTNSAAPPYNHDSQITFSRPVDDLDAQNFQVDSMGVGAAIQYAQRAGIWGARVWLGAAHYLIDMRVISVPLAHEINGRFNVLPRVDIEGMSPFASQLIAYKDLGPGNALVSCDDSTGTVDNQRGRYTSTGGSECYGEFKNFEATTFGATTVFGKSAVRPLINGLPIYMDGMYLSARRRLTNVIVDGFRYGFDFAGDHTLWDHFVAQGNFCGIMLDDPETVNGAGLFGDLGWRDFWSLQNEWANVCLAPGAYFNGNMSGHNYLGGSLYAFYGMPGVPLVSPANTTIIQPANLISGAEIDGLNAEAINCGFIVDGNIAGASNGGTPYRVLQNVEFRGLFVNQPASLGNTQSVAGCAPKAYIDTLGAYGVSFTNVFPNTFPPFSNITSLMRVRNTSSGTFAPNTGGVSFSGAGAQYVGLLYANVSHALVAGAGGVGTQFYNDASYTLVSVTVPGNFENGREWLVNDASNATLPLGTLMEIGPPIVIGSTTSGPTARRAGTATAGTAAYLGVNMSPLGATPTGQLIIIASSGTQLPVSVTAAQTVGTLLKLDPANAGKATAATSLTDGTYVGTVVNANVVNSAPSTTTVYVVK
jgi:hypothetical protein